MKKIFGQKNNQMKVDNKNNSNDIKTLIKCPIYIKK